MDGSQQHREDRTKKLTPAEEIWHELVLSGIGGSTVQEAKFNLSYVEYQDWVAYANRRGSLNPSIRVEQALAMVCYLLTRGFKIKKETGAVYELNDFMPHAGEFKIEEKELTFESVARTLGVKV